MLDYAYTINETLLEVKDLSVTYDTPILRNVNFSIRNIVRPGLSQGQVNALLAPSGMGKTQLFRCIAGIQKPHEGAVYLTEEAHLVKAGDVGVVAQDYPLFWHLTVWDNVFMAAKRKLKDAEEARVKATELLERFGLSERKNQYPHQLSGGQRQRVAIMQQMVCSGHLLLMDEPFSGLDVNAKRKVQEMIQSVAAADELNSIIVTTHDIGAALAIADTVILLGRERDATGALIPGANVRHTYNLMDMGLTWRPNVEELPQFHELEREIVARFAEL